MGTRLQCLGYNGHCLTAGLFLWQRRKVIYWLRLTARRPANHYDQTCIEKKKKDTRQEVYRNWKKHCNAGTSSRRLRINKQYEIFVFILQLKRLLETAAWMVGKSLIEVIIDCNAHAGFFLLPPQIPGSSRTPGNQACYIHSSLVWLLALVALHLGSREPQVLLIKNTLIMCANGMY